MPADLIAVSVLSQLVNHGLGAMRAFSTTDQMGTGRSDCTGKGRERAGQRWVLRTLGHADTPQQMGCRGKKRCQGGQWRFVDCSKEHEEEKYTSEE